MLNKNVLLRSWIQVAAAFVRKKNTIFNNPHMSFSQTEMMQICAKSIVCSASTAQENLHFVSSIKLFQQLSLTPTT